MTLKDQSQGIISNLSWMFHYIIGMKIIGTLQQIVRATISKMIPKTFLQV